MVFALPNSNQVLRLIKSTTVKKIRKDVENAKTDEPNLQDIQMAVKLQLENVIDYIRNIMKPLFSNQFVVVPRLTKVPPGFTENALALALHDRPSYRKQSSDNSLDVDIAWAFLLPDCCFVHPANVFTSYSLAYSHTNDTPGHLDFTYYMEDIHKTNLRANGELTIQQNSLAQLNGKSGHFDDQHMAQTSPDHSSARKTPNSCTMNGSRAADISIAQGGNANSLLDTHPMDSAIFDSSAEEVSSFSQNVSDSSRNFTLSFEIKPKKAYMLPQTSVQKGKAQVCKFCMHQCLKFKDGKFSEMSGFCPLDFFSGDRRRMKQALRGLVQAPQHQLKICKNGEEVYGAEKRQDLQEILRPWFFQHTQATGSEDFLSQFLELVIEALLFSPGPVGAGDSRKLEDVENCSVEGNSTDVAMLASETRKPEVQSLICGNSPFFTSSDNTVSAPGLPLGCVLECMSRLQQMDQLDIHDVFLLHSALAQRMEAEPRLRSVWRWDGPYSDISWILGDPSRPDQAGSVEEDVLKVKRFLVSKTLQDCSIIVALRPSSKWQENKDQSNCLNFRGKVYEFSIAIIDLDPKCFDKVPFYYHQAVDIESAFEDLKS